jgi:hypothetical protein
MRYPIEQASNIPGSGNALYLYLMDNIHVPAKLCHDIWYKGCEKLKSDPNHPFRGFYPVGETLCISYGGSEMMDHTFTGEEKNPIFVRDLSKDAKNVLGLHMNMDPAAKVFNPLFREYDELPDKTRKDNELPTLSLAKSISSFLGSEDALYTEKDVVEMLIVAIKDCNSEAMRHILHGNHVAWCSARFMSTGVMEEDIKRSFYGQNAIDFYVKDIGTIMPGILYCLAILGVDPTEAIMGLTYDLWGIGDAAAELQHYMKTYSEIEA